MKYLLKMNEEEFEQYELSKKMLLLHLDEKFNFIKIDEI
jgi:translation elongation factor P/translation initiation factor 5A